MLIAFSSVLALLARQEWERMNARTAHERERTCLAQNIYREARHEPREGKIAVGLVTLSRTKARGYPRTICGVVWQRKALSWTLYPRYWKLPADGPLWRNTLSLPDELMRGAHAFPLALDCRPLFYKRTDNKGVSERSKRFFATLREMAPVGSHTFFCLSAEQKPAPKKRAKKASVPRDRGFFISSRGRSARRLRRS